MSANSTHHVEIERTPNAGWAETFWRALMPLKDKIANHSVFQRFRTANLPIEKVRKALVSFYPLVYHFRDHMRLNLAKTDQKNEGELLARSWLSENIAVEEKHANWWVLWGLSFGCRRNDFDHAQPIPEIDALNHYLWDVNIRGSLVEGIGATNLAIEWPTGEWVKKIATGTEAYSRKGLARLRRDSTRWVKAHAIYDDNHPFEAFELIKRCAETKIKRRNAFEATKRSMEYYLIALNHVSKV
jgi:pyrroloquinoline quinone (PQQ) biosynthesis protein C